MSSLSTKEVPKAANPKTFFPPIIASVGGLAIFLIIASTVLVSQPIGSTVHGYFYGIDDSRQIDPLSFNPFEDRGKSDSSDSKVISQQGDSKAVDSHDDIELLASDRTKSRNSTVEQLLEDQGKSKPTNREVISQQGDSKSVDSQDGIELSEPEQVKSNKLTVEQSASKIINEDNGDRSSLLSGNVQTGLKKNVEDATNLSGSSVSVSGCDLYDGKWIYDSTGPLYSNNSCPVLTQMQNCQGNGRPDKDYESWRWKPSRCDLLRFDPKKFLELMRGKTLAFIGDSVARNQMESMLCILWQVEEPKNRGNKKMQRFYFKSTSTMIVRIWSSWLVHQTPDPIDYAPAGVVKLHLDKPDEGFMQHIPTFDVIVLSSGHWFAKQSVYVLNNEIVGGQLWWPDKSKENKVNNIEAFGISVETILTSIGTHPNFTGLTIVRSFSPDHYEGGQWNTGGSCTGKTNPASESELVENGFTNIMHEKQVMGFNRALKKKTNGSGLKLMDITKVFSYRHDGHPGPYRSLNPNKVTKRGPDGKPPPQDCLHWCMPGPVDTWNELVFEIIRREFSQRESDSS